MKKAILILLTVFSVASVVYGQNCGWTDISQKSSTIAIYNLNGRKLIEKQIPAGTNNVEIDGSTLKSGIYFCRLNSRKNSVT